MRVQETKGGATWERKYEKEGTRCLWFFSLSLTSHVDTETQIICFTISQLEWSELFVFVCLLLECSLGGRGVVNVRRGIRSLRFRRRWRFSMVLGMLVRHRPVVWWFGVWFCCWRDKKGKGWGELSYVQSTFAGAVCYSIMIVVDVITNQSAGLREGDETDEEKCQEFHGFFELFWERGSTRTNGNKGQREWGLVRLIYKEFDFDVEFCFGAHEKPFCILQISTYEREYVELNA